RPAAYLGGGAGAAVQARLGRYRFRIRPAHGPVCDVLLGRPGAIDGGVLRWLRQGPAVRHRGPRTGQDGRPGHTGLAGQPGSASAAAYAGKRRGSAVPGGDPATEATAVDDAA